MALGMKWAYQPNYENLSIGWCQSSVWDLSSSIWNSGESGSPGNIESLVSVVLPWLISDTYNLHFLQYLYFRFSSETLLTTPISGERIAISFWITGALVFWLEISCIMALVLSDHIISSFLSSMDCMSRSLWDPACIGSSISKLSLGLLFQSLSLLFLLIPVKQDR